MSKRNSKSTITIAIIVAAGLAMLIGVGAMSYNTASASDRDKNNNNGNTSNDNNTNSSSMSSSDSSPAAMSGDKGHTNSPTYSDDSRPTPWEYKLNQKFTDYHNGVFKVRTGAGGHIGPLTMYFPRYAQIKVGESVMFFNPTNVAEPHTVTFVMNNGSDADFGAPFIIHSNATSADPSLNAEPVTSPGPNGTSVIVGLNDRSFSPTVIDQNGTVTHLPPNANYTLTGTEKYVNSGWIWPKGMSPPGMAPIDSFTVKFAKAGTYKYDCEVHPWMSGVVEVK